MAGLLELLNYTEVCPQTRGGRFETKNEYKLTKSNSIGVYVAITGGQEIKTSLKLA